jgi:glucan phosphoethanolaminetransferase (alkaline phosphatase superfamily)
MPTSITGSGSGKNLWQTSSAGSSSPAAAHHPPLWWSHLPKIIIPEYNFFSIFFFLNYKPNKMLKKLVAALFVISAAVLGYAIYLYTSFLKVKDVVISVSGKEQVEKELKPYRDFLIVMSVLTFFLAVVLMSLFSQKKAPGN